MADAYYIKGKLIKVWKLLSELSKSNTKYKYDAKYWMANWHNTGVLGVKKDEELAYKYYKEVIDFVLNKKIEYFNSNTTDCRLCIDFNFDMQPKLRMCGYYTVFSHNAHVE
ncbi:hypothetical protein F8M41_009207 [Gigaspora margarita]|uniref:Uncharacterized protein n=1 Tax=Gigaspora margarita TaxID=4874 RepID=A0A8H4EQP6_GIGMA|nr:hypothetical protein F8M41_009207 [Gigaspora margarita]